MDVGTWATPVTAAAGAADAVGALGALAVEPPAAGVAGWDDVADLTRVLAHLRRLVERLPGVLGQLAGHLEHPGGGDLYTVDPDTGDTVEGVVATATAALAAATDLLRDVARQLTTAQAAAGRLTTLGDAIPTPLEGP